LDDDTKKKTLNKLIKFIGDGYDEEAYEVKVIYIDEVNPVYANCEIIFRYKKEKRSIELKVNRRFNTSSPFSLKLAELCDGFDDK